MSGISDSNFCDIFDDVKEYSSKRDPVFDKVKKLYTESINSFEYDENERLEKEGSSYDKEKGREEFYKQVAILSAIILEYINKYTPKGKMTVSYFIQYVLGFCNYLTEQQDSTGYISKEKDTTFNSTDNFNLYQDYDIYDIILSPENSDTCIVDESTMDGKDYINFVIGPGVQEGTVHELASYVLGDVLDQFADSLKGKEVEISDGNVRVLNRFSIDEYNDGQIFFHIDSVKKEEKKEKKEKGKKEDEKLWDRDTYPIMDIEINHRAKNPYFDSWDEFMKSSDSILGCNCQYGAPLIHWSWTTNYKRDMRDIEGEEEKDDDDDNLLVMIFPSWTNSVSSIQVLVKKSDESRIKKFIREHQVKNV